MLGVEVAFVISDISVCTKRAGILTHGMSKETEKSRSKKNRMELSNLITVDEEPVTRNNLSVRESDIDRFTPNSNDGVHLNHVPNSRRQRSIPSPTFAIPHRRSERYREFEDKVVGNISERDEGAGSSSARYDTPAAERRRSVPCPNCNRSFTSKRDCETHFKTVHKKLRPHECSHCNARFGTKSNLNTHKKSVHEGVRPFRCSICEFPFKTRGNLDTHIQTVHEQRRDYQCEFCGQSFGTRSVLNRHVKMKHNDRRGRS